LRISVEQVTIAEMTFSFVAQISQLKYKNSVFTALTFLATGQIECVATARKTSDDAEKSTLA